MEKYRAQLETLRGHAHRSRYLLHRTKHHLIRAWRVKKRIKLLVAAGFLLYISILSRIYTTWYVYPNTKLGSVDISGKSTQDLDTLTQRFTTLPYRLRVQSREYSYTYPQLGVGIDKKLIHNAVFARNRQPFPFNAIALVRSYFIPVIIDPPLVFTQDFTYLIDQTVFDFSDAKDQMYFDAEGKSIVYIENEERYQFAEQYLKNLLVDRLGDNSTPLYPKLTKVVNIRAENAADADSRIKQIYLTPLTVLVDASGNSESFLLTEKELAHITNITLSQDQTNIAIHTNEDSFTRIINEHVKKLKFLSRGNVVTPKVIDDMTAVLQTRFAGRPAEALTISLDNGPNSSGSVASKYIEVDISQQKMFLFKNKSLYKTYRVSTGLEYPTPTGEFEILNKAGLGYSSIYNVWMAWWMGFNYSNELRAFFGIHELPYTLSGEDKIHRPADFIGKPNTGGCVALGIGDAEEVYKFADIGTKVVIYN